MPVGSQNRSTGTELISDDTPDTDMNDEGLYPSEDDLSMIEEGKAQVQMQVRRYSNSFVPTRPQPIKGSHLGRNVIERGDEIKVKAKGEQYSKTKRIQIRRSSQTRPMGHRKRKMQDAKKMVSEIYQDVKNVVHVRDRERKKEELHKIEEEEEESTTDKRRQYEEEGGKPMRRSSLRLIETSDDRSGPVNQYNLSTHRRRKRNNLVEKALSCLGMLQSDYINQDPDHYLTYYLHWTFRASFSTLFLSVYFIFICMVFVFALFILLSGHLRPTCIVPSSPNFRDSFALSWTTFTTVGYGNLYPSLTEQMEEPDCTFITFLTSFEAFIGVLYASFCGAIIFGKVLRIQSRAHVTFCDPILIQYGHHACKNKHKGDTDMMDMNKIPCPVLELRIANRQYHLGGCEIIDASLSCMVINTESDTSGASTLTPRDKDVDDVKYVTEKLSIDMPHLPFFKRLWTVKHTINDQSPILRPWVKRLVRRNGGYWPRDLNNYEAVRKSINFDQIIVNLSGTSNISASNVYAQKIYDDFDLSVGYQFVNIVYKHKVNKRMLLDLDMINDVTEQDGGGGEPMTVVVGQVS